VKISVSSSAHDKLCELQNGSPGFLRVNVVPGGCSGMTYNAMVDFAMNEADILVYDNNDVKIVTDNFSRYFLDGMHVEYSDDLIRPGFQLTNTYASESCGCGSSFSV
jgi:iron-sulfur cluster assembly accessory protein